MGPGGEPQKQTDSRKFPDRRSTQDVQTAGMMTSKVRGAAGSPTPATLLPRSQLLNAGNRTYFSNMPETRHVALKAARHYCRLLSYAMSSPLARNIQDHYEVLGV